MDTGPLIHLHRTVHAWTVPSGATFTVHNVGTDIHVTVAPDLPPLRLRMSGLKENDDPANQFLRHLYLELSPVVEEA